MSLSKRSLAFVGQHSCRLNICNETGWVNFMFRGYKNNIYFSLFQHLQVAWHIPRVKLQVFLRTKLRWIDEDAHYEDIVLCAALAHKREMSRVKIPHGWHQTYFAGSRQFR